MAWGYWSKHWMVHFLTAWALINTKSFHHLNLQLGLRCLHFISQITWKFTPSLCQNFQVVLLWKIINFIYLAKTSECSINASNECWKQWIPNLSIHEVNLIKLSNTMTLEKNTHLETKEHPMWPRERYHTKMIGAHKAITTPMLFLAASTAHYSTKNCLSSEETHLLQLPRGKNSCHWNLCIWISMRAFVGPTRGFIYGKKTYINKTLKVIII